MRVFVTGATGFVGEAVVRELLAAGHRVLGLARNDAAADKLTLWGAEVHRGDLTDTDSLAAGARACDGVIHTAFIHDFSNFATSVAIDLKAVETLVAALEGSGKPLVSTSGIATLPAGVVNTEKQPATSGSPRAASEQFVLAAADRGVRSSVVRLPPSVHGAGDHGFVPALINIARSKGFSAYVAGSVNRWCAVHRIDAAHAYRLALEHAAAGTIIHAVAEEEGISLREIAETIGAGLGLPVRSISKEEVDAHFEWLGRFVNIIDHPTSSAITRQTLGWNPEQIGLLADMKEHYFA
ncbi:MAG: SDR family oxidoreductase [Mucilaginibacter sp.]